MSDTRHQQVAAASGPTEGDGVSYRGIVWFIVILAATTFACQLLVWGMIAFMNRQAAQEDVASQSIAAPFGSTNVDCAPNPSPLAHERVTETPCISKEGQVLSGRNAPQPNLMADDPLGLKAFRAKEDEILDHYDVMDKNSGTYRIPIERAKQLLLERGIPGGTLTPAATEAPAAPAKVKK